MTSRVVPSSNSAVTTSCWSSVPGRSDPLGREDPQRLDPGSDGPIVAATRGDPARAGSAASIESRANRRPPSWGIAAVGLRTIKLRSGAIRLSRRPSWSWVSDSMIEGRVVAPQAEPEAPLPFRLPWQAPMLQPALESSGTTSVRKLAGRAHVGTLDADLDLGGLIPERSPGASPLPSALGRTTPPAADRRDPRRLDDEPALRGDVAERAVCRRERHGELLPRLGRPDDGCRLDLEADGSHRNARRSTGESAAGASSQSSARGNRIRARSR